MRITHGTMARNYTSNLHSSLSRLYDLSDKAQSFRKFNSFSENTSGAVRAMNVRRAIAKLETDYDNIENEVSRLEAAEDSLKQARQLVTSFDEKYLQGADSSNAPNREDITTQLTSIREQMLTMMNGQFSGTYMFGSTEGKERIWDFDNTSGTLTYLGYDVTDPMIADVMTMSPDDLRLDPSDSSYDPALKECFDKIRSSQYIDIGLGLNHDSSEAVKPNSAYDAALNGLEIFGYGEDNILLHMHKMIEYMDQDDFSLTTAGPMIDKLKELDGNISMAVTQIGTNHSYLKFSLDRLDSEKINLASRQEDIELQDPEVAIMNMKLQEYAYNAALQMGSRILQPTVFDYIR